MATETAVSVDAEEIVVRLTPADSIRLSKVLEGSFDKSPSASAVKKAVLEFGKDLSVACISSAGTPVSKDCTVSIKLEPISSENLVTSDTATNEHMFQLRRVEDAKRLYSTLKVKEWDLQGSLYKRFTSSDNRMILECILDDERSRCSVFLSNGQSDDFSD